MCTRDVIYVVGSVWCFDHRERDVESLWLKVWQQRTALGIQYREMLKLVEGNVWCGLLGSAHRKFRNWCSK